MEGLTLLSTMSELEHISTKTVLINVKLPAVDFITVSAAEAPSPICEMGSCTYTVIYKHQRYRSKTGLIRC